MSPPVEISIPSTSISSGTGSKKFTLYNITLRLPLRSFVVQKRYSEFSALHDTLAAQVGAPPPEPLPPKAWLRSTISSPDLTRDRQAGLEAYLRAIAESPDRRWRDTAAWRAFLNLPSSSTTNSTVSGHGAGGAGAGTLPNRGPVSMDPALWLDQHREMRACLHEARLSLARRDAVMDSSNNTTQAAEAGAAAKRSLVRASTLLTGLTDGLRGIQDGSRLGEGEIRRRRDLLAAGRVDRDGLERLSNSIAAIGPEDGAAGRPAKAGGERGMLLGSAASGTRTGRVIGGPPLAETAQTRELDNDGVLQLQKQEMESQDEQVRQLAAIIRRQKEMGLEIHDEVQVQTHMLGQLNDDVDRVGGKMSVAGRRLKKLGGGS